MALPSINSLIPPLPKLQEQLTGGLDKANFDDFRNTHLKLKMLPYCLAVASSALEALVSEIQKISSDYLSSEQSGSQTLSLPKPEVSDRLGYHVDHFLDAARRAQNAWIPYLSRRFHLGGLPNSLHKLTNQLESQDRGLPEEIRRELTTYWKNHGERLKNYRDLAQHFALVPSDARVLRADDGTLSIWFTIPNNPKCTSASKLSFENPTVHAFYYVRDQYCELVAFSARLCVKLMDESAANNKLH